MARVRADAGATIMELMVAMSIMSVFGSMLTAATIQMYRVTGRTESATAAQTQLNLAFQRLDRQIRYATWVATPGAVGADDYVEYLTERAGVSVCGELRLTSPAAQLQWRSWTDGAVPGAWTSLASGVNATTPFVTTQAGTATAYQTLTVSVTVTDVADTKELATTFTALNTVPTPDTPTQTPPVTQCSEGRSTP